MGMAIRVPELTIDDLDRMPDDGNRYELLDGMLLMTPAPSMGHQLFATALAVRLTADLDRSRACIVGPGAIQRGKRTQLQPDLLVFPARFASTKEWALVGEHWLAVEVLSRSSRVYDREFKRDAYFALGVKEVWLVDIARRAIEVCRSPGSGELVTDVIRWRVPSEKRIVSLDLQELFAAAE